MQIQDRAHTENRLKIFKITFHDCYNNNIIGIYTPDMLRELCKSYIIIQCAFMKLIFYVENNMMALCDWACAVFLHSMWFLVERTLYAITKKRLYGLNNTIHILMCIYGKLLMFLLVKPFQNSYTYIYNNYCKCPKVCYIWSNARIPYYRHTGRQTFASMA